MILNRFHTFSLLTAGIVSYFSGSFVGKYSSSCVVSANNGAAGPSNYLTRYSLDPDVYVGFAKLGLMIPPLGLMDTFTGPIGNSLKYLRYPTLIIEYDHMNRIARFACQHLTKDNAHDLNTVGRKKQIKTNKVFMSDIQKEKRIDSFFRTTEADYCTDNNLYADYLVPPNKSDDTTKVYPNIVLQAKRFHNGPWSTLNEYVKKLAETNKNVYVCTGPLFLPSNKSPFDKSTEKPEIYVKPYKRLSYVEYDLMGKNRVAVPTHFFKAILIEDDDGNLFFEGYMMPNTNTYYDRDALGQFNVERKTIEQNSGLYLFKNSDPSKIQTRYYQKPDPVPVPVPVAVPDLDDKKGKPGDGDGNFSSRPVSRNGNIYENLTFDASGDDFDKSIYGDGACGYTPKD
uniref:DNA/RNA non-specific endonuclease domain-containing protein n=1 Tax=Strigamia maritima TaxID=126957 RepID=T1IKI8_STRMM